MPTPADILLPLILLSSAATAASLLHPIDFLALQSLHKSLSDLPGSHFLSSWDFSSDPCSFPGVLCSLDRVVSLSLGDPRAGSPGLCGRLPASLSSLSHLSELSLVPGRVSGPIPSSLSSLTQLRFLALSRNLLSGPIPPSLSSLRQLRTLDLSSNLLSGPLPPSLGQLPSLTNLILCHNHLDGELPTFRSTSLVRLDLKRNDLAGPVPRLPTSLRYLSLSSNRLSGPIDASLSPLRRLTYLDLSRNQLSGRIPGVVFSFPITVLQLQRNALEGPVLPERKVAIETVDLSHNRLTGMVSPLFAGVRRLYLNDNRFTGEVPGGLVEGLAGGGVEVVYLQRNFLTGVEMGPEVEIPTSSSLCLQYNCMVPPKVQTSCPIRRHRARPRWECGGGGGGEGRRKGR